MGAGVAQQHPGQQQRQGHQFDRQNHTGARAMQVGKQQVVDRQQGNQAEKARQAQRPCQAQAWR
ncbi:hypothetical protein D3C80_2134900 [compost metagenome]